MIARLHHITQDNLKKTHTEQAQDALFGGCKWIQLRSKTLSEEEIIKEAIATLQLTKAHSAKLILNDNWELAHELKLDGVHVGLTDTPIDLIRTKVNNNDFIIGGTANNFEDIKLHHSHKAHYIGLGPLRFTSTKEKISPILGMEGYQSAITKCIESNIDLPIIAIGGIKAEDCSPLLTLGVHGVAIASEINKASNPVVQTKLFVQNLS